MSIESKLRADPRYAAQLAAHDERATSARTDPKDKKGRRAARPTYDSTGWLHPSKLQANVTDDLRGKAVTVIPEVSIPLSQRPRDRIRLDALVIDEVLENGRFVGHFSEAKGFTECSWLQKARRFADIYGLPIQIIKEA